jgi:hypothetical protein
MNGVTLTQMIVFLLVVAALVLLYFYLRNRQ